MSLLSEISFSPSKAPIIWCDNISALSLAANLVFHSRSKHVELEIHFVRDKVLAKELDVRYVPSLHQLVNGLTKPLSMTHFCDIQSKLGVIS